MSFVEFTEVAMLVLFGFSWPFNIIKSYRSRTARGKSVFFEIIVVIGYLFGLSGKFVSYSQTGHLALSVWFYVADIVMVGIDMFLYRRNTIIDREAAAAE